MCPFIRATDNNNAANRNSVRVAVTLGLTRHQGVTDLVGCDIAQVNPPESAAG